MKDKDKTKGQLINELEEMRQRIAEVETLETERKRVEEALHLQSEIVAHAAEGVHLVRAKDGVIIFANPRFEEMFGYSQDELVGKHVSVLNAPGERTPEEVAQEIIRSMEKNGRWHGEVHNIKKDGTRFWCRGTVAPFEHSVYGKVWVTVQENITERKQVEEALRESEEKFHKAFNSSPNSITIATLVDGITIEVNDSFPRLSGYTREEVIGRSASELNIWGDLADRDRVLRLLEEQGGILDEEFEFRLKSGEVKAGLLSAAQINISGQTCIISFVSDITERKQAEEALAESEEKFRLLTENSVMGTFIIQDSKMVYVNPSFAKVFGYRPEEIINTMIPSDFIHPDDIDLMMQRLADRYTGKVTDRDISFKGVKNDGSMISVEATAVLIEYTGKPAVIGTFVDITERKRAEQEVKESENKFRLLFNRVFDAIVMVDEKGQIVDVNETACRLLGRSKKELGKLSVGDIHPKKEMEKIQAAIARVLRNSIDYMGETAFIDKDGQIIPVEAGGVTLDIGGKTHIIASFRSISERKRAEEALRESEEKYRNLVELAPDAIISVDKNGIVTSCNQAFAEQTGYNKQELAGRYFTELPTMVSPDNTAAYNQLFASLSSGGELESFEFPWIHKDGTLRWGEVHAAVMMADGQFKGAQAIMRDITERRQAEDALKESEEKLRLMFESVTDGITVTDMNGVITDANSRVLEIHGYSSKDELLGKSAFESIAPLDRERAAVNMQRTLKEGSVKDIEYTLLKADGSSFPGELSASVLRDAFDNLVGFIAVTSDITERKQAEEERQRIQRLESIGTLAGGIAHDFNNLLTGISGYIGLAKRSVDAGENKKASDRLINAEKASLQAKELTQQLLTFARGGTPIKETTSIAELIKDTAGFALRGSNVRCEFSLPDNLWAVEVDEGQMNQVITNLVINADEAMPEGGIVNIRAKNIELKTDSTLPLPQGRYVEIGIQDHGIGIAEEHRQKIFDPYFTTKQKGSGLGLSTTYSIIQKHDGHIAVTSEVGVGATFQIYLPASRKRLPAKKEAVTETVVTGQGKILVMDDEKNIREVVKTILTEQGYAVEIVSGGSAAVKRYLKAKQSGQPFDMVILDLTVPGGMGGIEAIKELLEIEPDVKAIASSGYSGDLVMSRYRKYGFSGVLGKPYKIGELTKAVHKILQRKNK